MLSSNTITDLVLSEAAADMSGCTVLNQADRIHLHILLDHQLHMASVQCQAELSWPQLQDPTQYNSH